jgi:hypothetical protein
MTKYKIRNLKFEKDRDKRKRELSEEKTIRNNDSKRKNKTKNLGGKKNI